MKFKVLAVSAAVVFAFGCKKYEYDIHPPLLTSIDINGATDRVVLEAGINHSIYYRVEDNGGIDHLRITTQKGFRFEKEPVTTAGDWGFIYDIDYDQKTKSESLPFNIPANATPGSYRVKVEITDVNSNVVTEKSLDFTVVNNQQPNTSAVNCVSTSDGGMDDVTYANHTDRIILSGNVPAQSDIDTVKVEFWSPTKNMWTKRLAIPGASDTNLDLATLDQALNLGVDSDIPVGDYRLVVYIKDSANRVGTKIFKISVQY